MSTDTKVKKLIINRMTKNQFDSLPTKNENELYFVEDDNTFLTDAVSDGNQYVRQNGQWTKVTIPEGKDEVAVANEQPSDEAIKLWVDLDAPAEESEPIFEAPTDGKTYGRKDGTWVEASSGGGAGGSGVGQVDNTPDAENHGEIFNIYSGYYANKATGSYSHAEGRSTTASGVNSHAEGRSTTANGWFSHAEGIRTTASEYASHVEGTGNTASGSSSHAEGRSTTASGVNSHAEGEFNTASGRDSHAANFYTESNGFSQTVIGYKNTPESTPSVNSFDATKLAFVVGGGSDTETKNIFEVFFNGTTKAAGTITGATADYAEMFEWIDNNPNSEDRVGRLVNLVGEKIELANNNSDNIIGVISGNPVILGDAPNSWQGMYLDDEWGRPTYTDHEFEIERQKFNKETGKIETVTEIRKSHARSINQNYDSSLVYTPREERPEWAAVGMFGKLLVLQDGTLNAGGRCYPSQDGIATKSDKGYYVMKVINEHQALVLFR